MVCLPGDDWLFQCMSMCWSARMECLISSQSQIIRDLLRMVAAMLNSPIWCNKGGHAACCERCCAFLPMMKEKHPYMISSAPLLYASYKS